jgi:MFS family permease
MPILRLADRVGRRRMLLVSVLAFTVGTAATSVAWGLISFVVFQMIARLFLATEESLAGIVISEEVRPDRRGAGLTLLGIIAMTGFGLVALMLLVVPLTPLDWRVLYLAALPPLVLVAWLRRNLRETKAFTVAQDEARVQASFWPHVDLAHRPLLWRITVVLGTHGMLGTPVFFYAAELAQDGYDWEGLFTVIVIAAGPATLLGYVAGGRLSDRVGRRPVLIGSALVMVLGVALVFTQQRWLFAPGFFLLTGADAGLVAVRPAYISELFPTEVRATLLSFIFGVVVAAGSLGLVVVGVLDGTLTTRTSIYLLSAVMLAGLAAMRGLPETVGADVIRAEQPVP